jgi:hypothetical protein
MTVQALLPFVVRMCYERSQAARRPAMERLSDAAAAKAIPVQRFKSEPFAGQSLGIRDGSATRTRVGERSRE